ncbi:hypothetical protein [Williamsia sterculiae]|uniref:Lipoprotein LprG n=1 Tax=Williamsia sterculiae TaxID=1344003 RepID=A0A1N7H5J1_9NOCA|nr:hypothetical protein [Williamsia sterculiae]SIS20144.1 hypothetical protein SAMN05445060_3549 [Williamsia sterculiae]
MGHTVRKMFAGSAIAAIAVLGVAACSDDSSSSGSSSGSSAAQSTAAGASTSAQQGKLVAEVPNLTGKSSAVKLDPGFTDALTTLKLTPGTVGSATLEDGSLIFPITGGNVKYYQPGSIQPYVQGIINHEGSGFSLSSADTKVELKNFTIDPGTSKLMGDVFANGQEAAKQAVIFDLDGSTLKPLQTNPDGTAVLEGTKVNISETAAGLLNKTFKTDAVKPGLLVGIAKITINTK